MNKFLIYLKKAKSVFIVYTMIMLILFTLLVSAYFQVSYGIGLTKNEIIIGENTTLHYEIYNKMIFDDMNNVVLEYWIEHEQNISIDIKEIKLRSIKLLSDVKNNINLSTSQLDVGEYRVWTRLTYSIGASREGVGNREAKLLSVKLSIITSSI